MTKTTIEISSIGPTGLIQSVINVNDLQEENLTFVCMFKKMNRTYNELRGFLDSKDSNLSKQITETDIRNFVDWLLEEELNGYLPLFNSKKYPYGQRILDIKVVNSSKKSKSKLLKIDGTTKILSDEILKSFKELFKRFKNK